MTRTDIYVLTTLVILIAGFLPCRSSECTESTISQCRWDNINDNDCEFYRKQVKCLENIDSSNCTDDEVKTTLSDALDSTREEADLCPGLPDGICYFNAMGTCEEDVPYEVIISTHMSDEDKRTACHGFRGKEEATWACYEALIPKCKAQRVLDEFDYELKLLNQTVTECLRLKENWISG